MTKTSTRRNKTAPKIRRQPADARIRYATTIVCESGHDFGVDLDKLAAFCGRWPTRVTCPYPCCPTPRVAIPAKVVR